MPMFNLHPYQKEVVKNTRTAISKGAKGVLIQSPPGSGKSVIIADIAKSTTDKGNRVLFIVHRQELVDQIEETFGKQEVSKELATVMTVGKVANRLNSLSTPDLIITDESHHSRAKTYRKIYDHYENAFRLGFTATPWRMSGEGFTDIYDEMIAGKSVSWLIENNFLAPFDYYAPTLTDLEYLKKSKYGDYTKKSIDEAIKGELFGNVVKHYKELADGKRTILYAHSVEASVHFAEVFKEAGINAVHADAKTNKKERDQIMSDFRSGKIQVLCNVDLVSEGFDVPDCHCVILARPTASLVLHLQQSMRAMRYQPGKKAIIIDHVANYTKHGLPSTPHDWTIEGRDKKTNAGSEISLKTCVACFAAFLSTEDACPLCGHEVEKEDAANKLKELEGNLQKIDAIDFQTNYEAIHLKKKFGKKDIKELDTLEDFYLFAKARGYKETWIKYNFKDYKHKPYHAFYSELKPIKIKYKGVF